MLVVVDVRQKKNGIVPHVGSRNAVEAVVVRRIHDHIVEFTHLPATAAAWSKLLDSIEVDEGYNAVPKSCTHRLQTTTTAGAGSRTPLNLLDGPGQKQPFDIVYVVYSPDWHQLGYSGASPSLLG